MLVDIIDVNGKVLEKFEAIEPTVNENLEHGLYLLRNLQNHEKSTKTAAVKNRSAVRGGGRKPYKQKGTGRARRGTNRSPLMVGGGVIFGPQPIKRGMKLNKILVKNVIQNALVKRKDDIKIIKLAGIDFGSVKKMVGREETGVLLITDIARNENLIKSFRNLKNVRINDFKKIEVIDLFSVDQIYIDYEIMSQIFLGKGEI